MKKWIWVALFFALPAGNAGASSLELDFNDFSAQLGYQFSLMEDNLGRSLLGAGFLYNDHEETTLGTVGVDFAGEPGNVPGLEVAVGARVFGGEADHQDLIAVGIGAGADYYPPLLGGLGVSGEVFYAPQVFSFLDADRLLQSEVRLGFAVTPRARVHVGYQNIRADFEDTGNWTIDDAVRIGFTARF